MWFVFALITALAWGGADLFYKKGSDEKTPYTHLRITVMVGLVMGVYAILNRQDTADLVMIIIGVLVAVSGVLKLVEGYRAKQ